MVRICSLAALVVLCASVVSAQERAQREGGRGGGGGRFASKVGLLSIEEVQAELKLSDEQKKQVTEIAESVRGRRGGGEGGGDIQARMEEFRKRAADRPVRAASRRAGNHGREGRRAGAADG